MSIILYTAFLSGQSNANHLTVLFIPFVQLKKKKLEARTKLENLEDLEKIITLKKRKKVKKVKVLVDKEPEQEVIVRSSDKVF